MTDDNSQSAAIIVKDVTKSFIREDKSENSIRKRLYNLRKKKSRSKLVALKNVTFSIPKGEFFGIVGRNGSGKSTLLKLIIGAYKPDKGGSIITNGKVIRLALGLGFDPNLSVRDNIYVNGTILGLSFKEIGTKFTEIIEFAELQDFVDTPIRFLSSGMRSKLAFSISMYVDADILLIDEFFGGVGDISFKSKSEAIFKDRILNNKTIVFISHNLELIKKYCDRAGIIDKGRLISVGSPEDIAREYKNLYK